MDCITGQHTPTLEQKTENRNKKKVAGRDKFKSDGPPGALGAHVRCQSVWISVKKISAYFKHKQTHTHTHRSLSGVGKQQTQLKQVLFLYIFSTLLKEKREKEQTLKNKVFVKVNFVRFFLSFFLLFTFYRTQLPCSSSIHFTGTHIMLTTTTKQKVLHFEPTKESATHCSHTLSLNFVFSVLSL